MNVMDDGLCLPRNPVSPRFIRVVLGALLALLLVPAAAHADTVFGPGDGPGGDALSDSPIEVGMKIRSSQAGYITALRFYKQPNNTGTHIGHLWSADGQQLAEAHVRERDRLGLAGAAAVGARGDHGQHHLRRLVLLAAGQVRLQPRLLQLHRRQRRARPRRPATTASTSTARRRRFPNETWNSTNYWVDAELQHHAAGRHAAAEGDRRDARPTARPTSRPRPRRPRPSTSRWPPPRSPTSP